MTSRHTARSPSPSCHCPSLQTSSSAPFRYHPYSWETPSRLFTGPILGAGCRLVLIIHVSQFCLYVVQDCLSLFFEQTVLTGGEQMLCSVCELRRESTVLTCLDKPPEVLMLHLKRWVETSASYASLINECTKCKTIEDFNHYQQNNLN